MYQTVLCGSNRDNGPIMIPVFVLWYSNNHVGVATEDVADLLLFKQ